MTAARIAVDGMWVACVLAAAWIRRPRPQRRPAGSAGLAVSVGPVTMAGGAARRLARRPPDLAADRIVGWAMVGVTVALAAAPALVPLPVVIAWAVPRGVARRRARLETAALDDALPDAVDLFSLAVGAGLTVPLALPIVAKRAPPPLGPALAAADRRRSLGEPLVDALGAVLPEQESVRPLVAVLVASLRDGAPLAEPLARLADDLRQDRQRAAEARARRVPVQMLFPLVLCTLPAFVLVTIVPVLAGALRGLRA